MPITFAQAPVYGYAAGGGATLSLSLGATPTPGNLLVYLVGGNDHGTEPTGFTAIVSNSTLMNSSLYASAREVQSGDTTGPYSYTTLGTGWDSLGVLMELAGATRLISNITNFCSGNAMYTSASHSMVASATIATQIGIVLALWTVYTANTLQTVGADAINQGFTTDYSWAANAASGGYNCFGHRLDAAATTAGPTATMPNLTIGTGYQSQLTVVIPGSTDSNNPSDVRAAFSDTPAFSIGHTLTPSDTRAAFSDNPGFAITQNLGVADVRAGFSDTPGLAIAHVIAPSDVRAPFSDVPSFASMLQSLGVSDVRAPFSDVVGLTHFTPGIGAVGNADNPSGAIGNGGVAGGTIGNSRPGLP